MGVSSRVISVNKGCSMERKEKLNYKENQDFYADTMERENAISVLKDINREKGIFTNDYADGLNQEKGIFNSTAIFRTSTEEKMGEPNGTR